MNVIEIPGEAPLFFQVVDFVMDIRGCTDVVSIKATEGALVHAQTGLHGRQIHAYDFRLWVFFACSSVSEGLRTSSKTRTKVQSPYPWSGVNLSAAYF